ncbi:VOC family protein [Nocardioides sp. AE5]|nr:VOC family protein [Nocardioides sp. AE5]MDT0203549.1 VOC family protein [Nocardioides sp. AE5]
MPGQPGPEGETMLVGFELLGQQYVAINGGADFSFTEAISLKVRCADQAEIDRVWAGLVEGGTELPCGWLKDKYGLAWQVSPAGFHQWPQGDPEAVQRFMARMLATHGKFDIAELQAAYDGTA